MTTLPRREFLRRSAALAGSTAALTLLPASIRRALSIAADVQTGTIDDVQHVVILMQENRSFDHYFGTLRGVRGFGDPFPIPLASGKSVFFEVDGATEISPYHLNPEISSALLVPDTPHTFADAQAAWSQGLFGQWPRFKTQYSMGYYRRADLPFQFALAEAFTLCDNHHCSVTTGTDPNRIAFFSGSNVNPAVRARGINGTVATAEVNNLRCAVQGRLPAPGYTYTGSAFTWPTLMELLQAAGISWRIYQNPNDNAGGLFHGGLAFENFRKATAASGGPLYERGMTARSIAELQADAANGTLPQVSWILPSMAQSEHPGACSPDAGADFISTVLDAITANPAVWSRTAMFLTFDENDGFFDHVPPPAVPSYNEDGTLAGASTLPLAGEYFSDPTRAYLNPADTVSGTVRPWGLGPRVPLLVISPWSRGGWVNSQVFDHTSIGRFLEKRFGIEVASIGPWHRAVSGDLTSAFDFAAPNAAALPVFPDMSDHAATDAAQARLPLPKAPAAPQALYQEPGTRPSRALPYVLGVDATVSGNTVSLEFANTGTQGVVFHVYDRLHLGRIPRRYTVEAGKSWRAEWLTAADAGAYDLWVYAPNGFVRSFQGNTASLAVAAFRPELRAAYAPSAMQLVLTLHNACTRPGVVTVTPNTPWLGVGVQNLTVPAAHSAQLALSLAGSHAWYDVTIAASDFERRVAGRMETGRDGVSDPAMAASL